MGSKRIARHTCGGKPATVVQLLVLADNYGAPMPLQHIGPHFCCRCTQPLDGTVCHVCTKYRAEREVELRAESDRILCREVGCLRD